MYQGVLARYARGGCEIVHTCNGQEALDYLHGTPDVDLILLDVNMPVMSGLEFLQERQKHALMRESSARCVLHRGAG